MKYGIVWLHTYILLYILEDFMGKAKKIVFNNVIRFLCRIFSISKKKITNIFFKKPVKSEHILIRQEKDMRWYAEENSVSYAVHVQINEIRARILYHFLPFPKFWRYRPTNYILMNYFVTEYEYGIMIFNYSLFYIIMNELISMF